MTKQKRKYILYISLLLVFSLVAVYFVLKDNGKQIWETIIHSNWKWLLIALLFLIGTYILNAVILTILARIYNRKYKFRQAYANYMIGQFFNGITPSASGGQFAQAYTFSKQSVKVTNAASILFMAFIIHQAVAILFSAITFGFKYIDMTYITETFPLFGLDINIINLSLIGFLVNFIVLLGLFLFAFSKKLHYVFVHGGINLLRKMHIFKKEKADKMIKNMDAKIATFRVELKRLLTNWKVLIICVLLVFVDMGLKSSFPYLMGKAVGAPMQGSFFDGICMTNFTNLITMMIPIPGAAGGAELVFQFMFKNFMGGGSQYVGSINLLWRVFSFYINVILGALIFIFYHESPKENVMELEITPMSNIVVLSLTQEIDFNNKEFIKEIKKMRKDNNKSDKKRTKYRPKLLDEEDVEQRFLNVKEELKTQLENNEKEMLDEKEKKENNQGEE